MTECRSEDLKRRLSRWTSSGKECVPFGDVRRSTVAAVARIPDRFPKVWFRSQTDSAGQPASRRQPESGDPRGILCFVTLMLVSLLGCDTPDDTTEIGPPPDTAPRMLFSSVADDWGIEFADNPRDAHDYPLAAIMGSGCAIADLDGDGRAELLLLAQSSRGRNAALYFRNDAGRFVDRTEEFGLQDVAGTGVAVGDCNNDGWPDLYITSTTGDSLWLNREGQRFVDVTSACGIENERWGTAACWADFDRDGWLDLFVTNYVRYEHRPCTRLGGGDRDFCGPVLFDRTPDLLFRNTTGESADGTVRFENVSSEVGISSGLSAGLGVTAADFTGDGLQDFYVASDQHANLLWVQRDGRFIDEAAARGCDLDFQGKAQASMGIALGDVTGNGADEVIVAHLDGESHAVYESSGKNFFVDVCRQHGIADATRALTGFGVCVQDFDCDGRSDILTVNGRVRRMSPLGKASVDFWAPYQQRLQLLQPDERSSAESSTFVYRESMNDLGQHVARGLAYGDIDDDGDVDVLVSTVGENALVLRNDVQSSAFVIAVRPIDPTVGGRSCYGAHLVITVGNRRRQTEFQPCQSYASTHLDEVYICVPEEHSSFTVDVVWPHGSAAPERFEPIVSHGATALLSRGSGQPVK